MMAWIWLGLVPEAVRQHSPARPHPAGCAVHGDLAAVFADWDVISGWVKQGTPPLMVPCPAAIPACGQGQA